MFTLKRSKEPTELDNAIDRLLGHLSVMDVGSPEYNKTLEQVTRLYKLLEVNPQQSVSPDTIFLVAGNLVGILIIVGYEHAHVVATKALGLLTRTR